MMVSLSSLAFVLAIVCAALMGFAIQRGATCTVAAVGEIIQEGKAAKLRAMAEAGLWVAGGLLIARTVGLSPGLPDGYAINYWTILGAIFLGIGAWVNSACVFGAIARFGSGDWAYALTPLGFYLGAISLPGLFSDAMPVAHKLGLELPTWLTLLFVLYAIWRLIGLVRHVRTGKRTAAQVWAPHEATILIGITFVILFVSVGAWAYTDLLVRLARGMTEQLDWRLILFVALLCGASFGGWRAGKLGSKRPGIVTMVRCLVGGMLMGWGSVLIPGSNDGLILIGAPLLMPYAWAAILTMWVTLWIVLKAEQRLKRL